MTKNSWLPETKTRYGFIITSSAGSLLLVACSLQLAWTFTITFVQHEWAITSRYSLTVVCGAYYVGVIAGAIVGNVLVDRIGRKRTLLVGVITILTSGINLVSRPNEFVFATIARFMAGLTFGIVYLTQVIYIGECSSVNYRGHYAVTVPSSIYFGVFLQFVISQYADASIMDTITSSLTIVVGVLGGAALFFMKESFVYNIMRGRDQDAFFSFIYLRSQHTRPDELNKEFEDIKALLYEEYGQTSNQFAMSCMTEGNVKAFLITLLLKVTNAATYNVVLYHLYFLSLIWVIDDEWLHVLMLLPSVIRIIGPTLVASFVVDKHGRRLLLITSGICAAISLLIVRIASTDAFYGGKEHLNNDVYWLVVVFFYVFEFACSLGFGCVPDVLLSESFTFCAKNSSIAIILCVQAAVGLVFLNFRIYVSYTDASIWTLYSIIASLCLTSAAVARWLLPKTEGRSLREVKDLYRIRDGLIYYTGGNH